MADFTATTGLVFQLNTGTPASGTSAAQTGAVWTSLNNGGSGGANELRFSDVSSAGATASASWPYMTRPGSTQLVSYQYAFTADTTSLGYLGTSSTTPTAWANASFNDARWAWDATGTFASAPIFTAYPTSAHGSITRGDASLLGGHTTDTGGTARSYLKGALAGQVDGSSALASMTSLGNQGPVAAATAPTVTDGTTGAVTPTSGANWSSSQSLQGDNDYLQAAQTPTATQINAYRMMLDLWTGPNMATGTYTVVLSCKYTYA